MRRISRVRDISIICMFTFQSLPPTSLPHPALPFLLPLLYIKCIRIMWIVKATLHKCTNTMCTHSNSIQFWFAYCFCSGSRCIRVDDNSAARNVFHPIKSMEPILRFKSYSSIYVNISSCRNKKKKLKATPLL